MSLDGRTKVFTAILIHTGSGRGQMLRYLVSSAECLEVIRDLEHTPSEHELVRLLGAALPEVVIVDIGTMDCLPIAQLVREACPSAAILGFGPTTETAMIAGRLGYDAIIEESTRPEEMRQTVQECLRSRFGGVEPSLRCFLPSKAGSGCSTVVMNTAAAMARDLGKKVLVLDADLRSGVLAILLGVDPVRSIQSTLSNINQIDRNRFADCVHSSGGVDYLLSSRSLDAAPPDWSDYFHLFAMAKPLYDYVLVDMPELVNPASFELVRRAAQTFIVCTPEIPSMTLARHRCEELERIKIPNERVGLLVNRWQRSDPSPAEIGELVDREVSKVFPNDYPVVRTAILGGKPVSERSRLGQTYTEFAAELCGGQVAKSGSISGKLKSLWGIRETIVSG